MKIKALHIAPTPFFSNRGCHIRIRNVVRALEDQGVENVLCTYHHGRSVQEIDTRRIVKIPGYTKKGVGFSPFKFVADIPLFFLALSIAWREKPAVIHGHLHEGACIGWAVKTALFWRTIRLVMDVQGSLSGELEEYGVFRSFRPAISLFRFVERVVCRMPSFFFCSSDGGREMLHRQFGVSSEKTAVTDDGVAADYFDTRDKTSIRRELDLPLEKTIVIYTGSLLEGKGIQHVYDSMRSLCADRSDLLFLLIGYPTQGAEDFVRAHQLENCCRIVGEVDYEKLPTFLRAADLALEPKSPKSGEASGKLLHYMGAGLAVVCFDSSNNRRFLEKDGFFAEPGSSDDFASQIEQAIKQPEERTRQGEVNRRRVLERFSWEKGGRTMIEAYRKLLS